MLETLFCCSCAWKDSRCRIGLILGTGTNACYLEDIKARASLFLYCSFHLVCRFQNQWHTIRITSDLWIFLSRFGMFPAVLRIWIRIDLVTWLFWIRAREIGTFWQWSDTRVSFETSFDSKQPKLEPKLNVCFGCFASIPKQRVSMFWLNRNKQKTNRNSLIGSIFYKKN